MKIALLFYGYMRQYKLCYKNILKQLNIEQDDIDIFIYTSKHNHLKLLNFRPVKWENIENNTKQVFQNYFGDSLKDVMFKEDDDNYKNITTNKFLNMKKYYFDFIKNNLDYLKNIQNHNFKRIKDYVNLNNVNLNNHFKTKPWIFRQTDQFINLFLCSNLFHKYNENRQIEYDFVIQMRPDVIFPNKLDIKKHLDNIKKDKLLAIPGIDYFYISNQKINKKISEIYKHYGLIEKDGLIHKTYFSPEAQSSNFLKNNFEIIKFRLRTNYLRYFKNISLRDNIYKEYENECEKIYNKKMKNIQQPILHL